MTELYKRVISIQEQLVHADGTSTSCLRKDSVNDSDFIQDALLAMRRSELQPGGIRHEANW